jgi:tRNA-splicing endonuclease subunit Sen34
MAPVAVTEPFPISCIAGRYLLFDVDVVSHVRRTYNICGVLIGTIPNLSQQNIFLGLPVELLPEEARVLVEKSHAYIVDDVSVHREGFMEMNRTDRLAFLEHMDKLGAEKSQESKRKLEERSERALREKGLLSKVSTTLADGGEGSEGGTAASAKAEEVVRLPKAKLETHHVTPATSYPPLPAPSINQALALPEVPASYPLFRYMNSQGYFSMPGLRFGCHYTLYPGDPLRFHSHFLATGLQWDDEFDMLDIVGGGRLGTGVKKAYLIGGEKPSADEAKENDEDVRAFSIEWAGFG